MYFGITGILIVGMVPNFGLKSLKFRAEISEIDEPFYRPITDLKAGLKLKGYKGRLNSFKARDRAGWKPPELL